MQFVKFCGTVMSVKILDQLFYVMFEGSRQKSPRPAGSGAEAQWVSGAKAQNFRSQIYILQIHSLQLINAGHYHILHGKIKKEPEKP